jgi:hypothetical protein
MRIGVPTLLLLFPSMVAAEQYTCTYEGYLTKQPVILKVRIEGTNAYVGDDEYQVLENTKIGLVLVRSFAFRSRDRERDEVGLFGFTINKSTLHMTRGNIIQSDGDGAVRHGRCLADRSNKTMEPTR